uniref:Nucleotide-diphospho-sugar transferase domain-containing protein n=2 Tax=Strongyloides stercoralis TaxID=6248 RepID=A0A0K0E298_STRER
MRTFCSILFLIIIFFIFYYFNLISNNNKYQNKINNYKILEVSNIKKNIAIIMVIEGELNDYNKESYQTIKCYSLQNNYSFQVVSKFLYPDLFINCKQTNFIFRRHCVVAKFAEKYQSIFKYIIFVSNKVGVINPLHKIEKYLPRKGEEIIFYEKISQNEISTESYILKNTNYSRNLLKFFANYICSVPKKYSNSDNSAIQAVFVTLFGGDKYLNVYNHCINLWFNETILFDNTVFESCMKWILKKLNENKGDKYYMLFDDKRVVLLTKFSTRTWIRSGLLNNWHFSKKDFFFNEWETNKVSIINPIFKTNFIPTDNLCKSSNYLSAWNYNPSINVSNKVIENIINNLSLSSENNYYMNLTLCNLYKVSTSKKRTYLKIIYN